MNNFCRSNNMLQAKRMQCSSNFFTILSLPEESKIIFGMVKKDILLLLFKLLEVTVNKFWMYLFVYQRIGMTNKMSKLVVFFHHSIQVITSFQINTGTAKNEMALYWNSKDLIWLWMVIIFIGFPWFVLVLVIQIYLSKTYQKILALAEKILNASLVS